MSVKQDKLLNVEKLDIISNTRHRLLLHFEREGDFYCNGNYSEFLDLQGEELTFCEDIGIHEGKQVKFATELTLIQKVNVVEADTLTKLYPDSYPKNECTIAFDDVEIGQAPMDVVVYCTAVEYCASDKADWRTLTILDSNWRIAHCKQFSPADRSEAFVGKYITIALAKDKYGFKVASNTPLNGAIYICEQLQGLVNPRILLSENYIRSIIKDDEELMSVVNKTNLLEKIKSFGMIEEMEIGYELVRLANEIYLAKSLINITPNCDIRLVIRVLLMSRLFMTAMSDTSQLSSEPMSIVLARQHRIVNNNPEILGLLDSRSPINIPERDVISAIKQLSNTVVDIDKTYKYSERRAFM